MTVKEDILKIKAAQEDIYKKDKAYLRTSPTPATIPEKGDVTTFTELNAGPRQTEKMTFTPTAKDYQYTVHTTSGKGGDGCVVVAKRDLGDGMIETIESEEGWC